MAYPGSQYKIWIRMRLAVVPSILLIAGSCAVIPSASVPTGDPIHSEYVCKPSQSQSSCFYKRDNNVRRTKLIIFAHGVFGSGTSTWGDVDAENFWPSLISADPRFKDFDVYIMNYYTTYLKRAPTIHEIAVNELSSLKDKGVFRHYHEIHFIAHSMGGLVVKDMLVSLHDDEALQKIRTVVSLGTPAQGSTLVNLGNWISGNPQLKGMEPASTNHFIQLLEDEWIKLMLARDKANTRYPRVYCAYETLPTFGAFVVPREMAASRCDAPPYPMQLNHFGLVQATGIDKDPYLWVMARIGETSAEADILRKAANLVQQATQLTEFNQYDDARNAYLEARILYKQDANPTGEGDALLGLGQLERKLGRNDQARVAYIEARALFRAVGNRRREADVIFLLVT